MAPKTSLQDAEGPPSHENEIGPLGHSLCGVEPVISDEVTAADAATTLNAAATVDTSATAGKAASVEPGIHKKSSQQIQMISTQSETSETPAIEDPILTSSSSHSSGQFQLSAINQEMLTHVF